MEQKLWQEEGLAHVSFCQEVSEDFKIVKKYKYSFLLLD